MSTPATDSIALAMLPPNVTAQCVQCGKPAAAWFDAGPRKIAVCRSHAWLALNHFITSHGLAL